MLLLVIKRALFPGVLAFLSVYGGAWDNGYLSPSFRVSSLIC